jgi:cellulose synthase operon protein B
MRLADSLVRFTLIIAACVAACFCGGIADAQSDAGAATATPPREVKLSFAQLGVGPIELRGVQSIGAISLGTRLDEVVVAAKLRLRLTYSPALLPDLSHLRVSLNGQVIAALPLPKEQAGREVEREIALDTRYFSDYNQIRFDLIGHYTLECEDPQHTSLWATLSQRSELELMVRSLELRNDLALLPAPFFDRRDNRRLTLPVVLPPQPARALVRTVGVAASWFGMLADYRSARFPVSFGELPRQHALVFATNSARPAQLQLAEVHKPTISILDHPLDANVKLLVFQGQDEVQLQHAVEGLVLGNPVFTGTSATVTRVKYRRREAYDAPRWLRTDRPVKLGELVDSPESLQAYGISPAPIRINLRLPPDLFTWNRAGVPVDLRYRYTMPVERDNSMLSISINNQLLRSYRLQAEAESGTGGKLRVPLLGNATSQRADDFLIPAFQLSSNNQLQFQFSLAYHRKGLCTEVFTDTSRQAVDPDSTIDVSHFAHYTALPNLALFANAGYPFTRFADLGETGIVLPDTADRAGIEQLLFVLGRMGRHTGAVAVAYRLLDVEQALRSKDSDLLVLGVGRNGLLERWGKDLTLVLEDTARKFRDAPAAMSFAVNPARAAITRDSQVDINANGSLGALLSFESPLGNRRTVVALAGTDAHAANALIDTLEDEGKVPQIRGALTIVRPGSVQSYQADALYYVGSLSWWQRLWFHLSQHPVLLTLVTLITAIVIALFLYGWLQRRVARRLENQHPG